MTPKQQLVAHLEAMHDGNIVYRGTHKQLILRHRAAHQAHLTHSHKPDGWTTGGEQIEVRIFLAPPKNPASNNAKDRNWVLNITDMKSGHRYEIPGTVAGDPDGAKAAANTILGYEATWAVRGWGWEAK